MKKPTLIIGLGRFGSALALALNEQGMEVIGVDINRQAVDRLKDTLDHVVQGDIRDRAVLEDLCRDGVDVAVLAFGDKIEQSVLATLYLKEIGVPRIVARANNEDYAQVLLKIGADKIIRPIQDAALHLAGALTSPNIVNFVHLGEDFAVLEFEIGEKLARKTIRELEWPKRYHVVALGIKPATVDESEPDNVDRIDPDHKLRIGDRVLVAGKTKDLESFRSEN